jgi:hypothetical protein
MRDRDALMSFVSTALTKARLLDGTPVAGLL